MAEQIESICRQTHTNLEILVCDDASSDNTYEILEAYAVKDKRIRLLRNEVNLGFRQNFSRLSMKATADIIAFSDQDDIWHEQKIRKMLDFWPEQCSLVYCDSQRFTGKEPAPSQNRPLKNYRRFEGTCIEKLVVFNTISGHALMLRRHLLPLIFPVGEGIFYDWKAGIAGAVHGGVAYIPETLVFQRVHENNITVGGSFDWNNTAGRLPFKKMIIAHAIEFQNISGISAQERAFLQQSADAFSHSLKTSFSWPLFKFLFINRRNIFWHKRKKFPLLSSIKYCYRLAHF